MRLLPTYVVCCSMVLSVFCISDCFGATVSADEMVHIEGKLLKFPDDGNEAVISFVNQSTGTMYSHRIKRGPCFNLTVPPGSYKLRINISEDKAYHVKPFLIVDKMQHEICLTLESNEVSISPPGCDGCGRKLGLYLVGIGGGGILGTLIDLGEGAVVSESKP